MKRGSSADISVEVDSQDARDYSQPTLRNIFHRRLPPVRDAEITSKALCDSVSNAQF